MPDTPSVLVGATGGSGTRVIARILERAQVYKGAQLNAAHDALLFTDFYKRWGSFYVPAPPDPVPAELEKQMIHDLERRIQAHLAERGDSGAVWGWKNPRNIFVISFFHRLFPSCRFIHLVRDGRDMAFSRNQLQLRDLGPKVLGEELAGSLPPPLASMAMWSTVNLRAAVYGEARMPNLYLCVRLEDLCAHPIEQSARLLEFAGLDPALAPSLADEVQTPSSFGRWRQQPLATTRPLEQLGRAALRFFGYGHNEPASCASLR